MRGLCFALLSGLSRRMEYGTYFSGRQAKEKVERVAWKYGVKK